MDIVASKEKARWLTPSDVIALMLRYMLILSAVALPTAIPAIELPDALPVPRVSKDSMEWLETGARYYSVPSPLGPVGIEIPLTPLRTPSAPEHHFLDNPIRLLEAYKAYRQLPTPGLSLDK